jgi:hypothetical protein
MFSASEQGGEYHRPEWDIHTCSTLYAIDIRKKDLQGRSTFLLDASWPYADSQDFNRADIARYDLGFDSDSIPSESRVS